MTLDVNSSTNISAMKTFLSNTGNIAKNSGKSLDSIFQEADKNKNGKLDSDEVSAILKEWKMDGTFSMSDVMSAVDSNGDGEISFDEIKSYASTLGVDIDGNKTLGSTLLGLTNLGGGIGDALNNVLGFFKGDKSQAEGTSEA